MKAAIYARMSTDKQAERSAVRPDMKRIKMRWALVAALIGCGDSDPANYGPTRASESEYNRDITRATTSRELSNADIAWHAANTFGWDCDEVVSREAQTGAYFFVTCSNGTKLRVYPRSGQHPRITNAGGGWV